MTDTIIATSGKVESANLPLDAGSKPAARTIHNFHTPYSLSPEGKLGLRLDYPMALANMAA
jgi:hypothetical protein